jgi:cell division protein FtsI/penicillin-binding protein 2
MESASGVRPTTAFLLISVVLLFCGFHIAVDFARGASRASSPLTREELGAPAFEIADRAGRPLARFVPSCSLVMSPNAMWQAHTPDRMAERIAEALAASGGGEALSIQELLERMLPGSEHGIVRADGLALDEQQVARIEAWLSGRNPSGAEGIPEHRLHQATAAEWTQPEGIWVEVRGGSYTLAWEPVVALSQAERARQGFGRSPLAFTRRLADDLARCLTGMDLPSGARREALRQWVWSLLMPSTHLRVLERLDPAAAHELCRLLEEEGVARHQMRVERSFERGYPFGNLSVLGHWGFIGPDLAGKLAAADLGLDPARDLSEGAPTPLLQAFARRTQEHLASRHPLAGLEILCDRLLVDDGFEFLSHEPSRYAYSVHRSARAGARAYFQNAEAASPAPRVQTTLDAVLQIQLGQALEALFDEHRPALAMAMVADVETGEVLAVDYRCAYEFNGFAPVQHVFTPGSTLKMLVMACALEQGVVTPHQTFDVGNGFYRLPSGRVIHEAESSRTGVNTAAECLAHSINAGMVQIGQRLEAGELRAALADLGLGRSSGCGLGGERPGWLPPLPWRADWTHASVSFGHEVSVTFWQLAAALTAVVRGGEFKALRLIHAVAQDGQGLELDPEPARRVFSEETCAKVRDMMHLGAQEGTGRHAFDASLLERFELGTKTGTSQKVPTEICLHVELAHQERHAREQTACTQRCRGALAGQARDHLSCYTSSMCAFGRLIPSQAGTPSAWAGRELMALVVVEEPRGEHKYGSRVAGPTAIRLLQAAFDTAAQQAQEDRGAEIEGFASSGSSLVNASEHPWAEMAQDGADAGGDGIEGTEDPWP